MLIFRCAIAVSVASSLIWNPTVSNSMNILYVTYDTYGHKLVLVGVTQVNRFRYFGIVQYRYYTVP